MGVEAMSATLKLFTQFWEIVNFPIKDNPNRAVLVEDRLMASGQIDNAEAAHAQAYAVFDENTFVVRTTVHNGLAHAMNGLGIDRPRCHTDDSCDSAHALSLIPQPFTTTGNDSALVAM